MIGQNLEDAQIALDLGQSISLHNTEAKEFILPQADIPDIFGETVTDSLFVTG